MAIEFEKTTGAPEFDLGAVYDDAEREALMDLQVFMRQSPEAVEGAIGLYFEAPDALRALLVYLNAYPTEGLRTLGVVHTVLSNKIDIEAEFDPATEAAVSEDAVFKNAVARFRTTKDEADRNWFRRRRFKIALDRAKAANPKAA